MELELLAEAIRTEQLLNSRQAGLRAIFYAAGDGSRLSRALGGGTARPAGGATARLQSPIGRQGEAR